MIDIGTNHAGPHSIAQEQMRGWAGQIVEGHVIQGQMICVSIMNGEQCLNIFVKGSF